MSRRWHVMGDEGGCLVRVVVRDERDDGTLYIFRIRESGRSEEVLKRNEGVLLEGSVGAEEGDHGVRNSAFDFAAVHPSCNASGHKAQADH